MGMSFSFDLAAFERSVNATKEQMHKAARPAAQAGAQVIYYRAKLNASTLRSDREHYFYGKTAAKAPKGQKQNFRYGPFKPGSLYESIYQAFSKDNSSETRATYHVSWNRDKAPYGAMVENGTSRAAPHPFISNAIHDGEGEALAAMERTFLALIS
jgi:HK97 gp10 family phage protein